MGWRLCFAAEQDAMANYCEGRGEDPVTHEMFKDPVTGKFVEHHFCANCPKAKGLVGHPGGGEPEIVHQVSVVRVTSTGVGPCPGCGMTFARFRETARLGCASCYTHFEKTLGPLIARAQEGATHHIGKLPKRAVTCASTPENKRSLMEVLGRAEERARKMAALRDQLHTALTSERYEQAALIRDQIEQLQSLYELPGEGQG